MNLQKRFYQLFVAPRIQKKIRSRSVYHWKGISLHLPSGVFHPAYFFSTKFLLKYILQLDLYGKTFLEPGAGNGLISFAAAKNGALVTATDISKKVVEALRANAASNQIHLNIIESDLFDRIPVQQFEIIAINPPYFPNDPRNEFEQAWYCGNNFEYFRKLFAQLPAFIHEKTKIIMVLSEVCELNTIKAIAEEHGFQFLQLVKKRIYWEWNYIFEITRQ